MLIKEERVQLLEDASRVQSDRKDSNGMPILSILREDK
jgi:hypothetical protein